MIEELTEEQAAAEEAKIAAEKKAAEDAAQKKAEEEAEPKIADEKKVSINSLTN